MGKRLFVGNLSYQATEMDVRDAFAEAGEIASVRVVLDRDTGRPRGFAFVEMGSDDAASQAINLLNGREMLGRPLTVREAEERAGGSRGSGGPRRSGGDFGGGGGGGYGGGGGGGGGYGGGGGGGGYGGEGGGGRGGRDRRPGGGGRNRF